jgi:hypothetical protein
MLIIGWRYSASVIYYRPSGDDRAIYYWYWDRNRDIDRPHVPV